MAGLKRIMAGLCLAFFLSAAAGAQPRVLVVESYHSDYPWDQDYRRALQERLGKRAQLSYYAMDTKRLPPAQHQARADEALAMAAKIKPELVIVGDDAALQRVGSKLAQRGVPVIYLGINNNPRNYFPGAASGVSGVLERPLILRSVFELGKTVKGLRSALVLFDDDLTSRIIRDETFVGRDTMLLANIHVDLALTGSYADWQRRVLGAAGRYQAIWIGLYFTLRDAGGKVVPGDEVLRWTAAHAKLPLFAFWDFAVGKDKAAGGLVLSGYEQGREAAKLAEQVLFHGKPVASLFPVTPSEGRYVFSREGLARDRIELPARLRERANWVE
ncbi:hypothetical protein DB032_19910 [Chromobacterium sp. Panama]|uniref:ABC transporter substrate-binding protein n=1 Tax=Chromobacterium sp. Panama TaxID=2161826 RepID=UPI000D2F5F0E|nr:hypothetical protein [Chromobacterium sp. Panama]PTU67027.1 hypothetical protein DB032_19910 [Chromobacterium sp. Panama]